MHRNHRLNAYYITLRNSILAVLDSKQLTKEQRPSWTNDLNNTAQKIVKYCPEIKFAFSNLDVNPKNIQDKIKVLAPLKETEKSQLADSVA